MTLRLAFLLNLAVSNPRPETVVELSVYDLVERLESKKKSPDYAKEVIKRIEAARSDLRQCIESETVGATFRFVAHFKINSIGQANFENDNGTNGKEACLIGKFKEMDFPKHSFKDAIEFELPILLKKEVL